MSAKAAFPHVVIRASAGTGKTHQLTVRFIGLLAAGARPDEILATTFTRKAAGEILDRVLFRLAQAAADKAVRDQLAEAIGGKPLSAERCRELLFTTLTRLHALRVGTLDSHFLQIATTFGHELGLPPGWSICDEMIDASLRDEAIELVLSRGNTADLLALVHALTKGAAARGVARLVHDTVTSLFELFRETDAAAWQQIKPCQGLADHELEAAILALESLPLADRRMLTARVEDLERFRASDWEAFLDKGLAVKVLTGECVYYKKPLPPELTALYERLLKHVESILVGQVARQTEATHQLLERFAGYYHALQLEEQSLRFSDVTFRLAAAASSVGPEQLGFRLDGGIRHILLDEFQDTSPSQWRVLRPLARQVTARGRGSFFCVGDAKQAIYGWRGGVAEIFDALDTELPGLKADNLVKSYRSAQPVIDAVNAVFQNLTKHPNLTSIEEPVRAWQQAFQQHTTTRTELAGHVTLRAAAAPCEDENQCDVVFRTAAERVHDCVAAAPRASVGVLVRTNAAVGRLIYLLRSLGVPASEEGGNPLVDAPAVELMLSLLKLADHPADGVARFHLATSPLATPLELTDHRSSAAAERASQRIRRQLLDSGYGATIFDWAAQLAPVCDERELSRLQQLVELAYEYQPTSTLRTSDFVRLVESRRVADPQAADVRVMTIHQAKGLQFDVVFLPEMEGQLKGQPDRFVAGRPTPMEPVNVVCRLVNENVRRFLPQRLQKLFEDDVHLEVSESLCVLYVAMTRAVHALHILIAPPKPSERHLPKTFAGLLRATLGGGLPATPEQVLYEHGDRNWFAQKVAGTLRVPSRKEKCVVTLPQDMPDGTRSVPTTIRLAPSSARRQRGWQRTSPSALEGGAHIAGATILAGRSPYSLGVGTLFHAWFEQIEWLDNGPPSDQQLRDLAASLLHDIGEVASHVGTHLKQFHAHLANPTIARPLLRAFYQSPVGLELEAFKAKRWPRGDVRLSVYRERPFAIHRGDELLTGKIDRYVLIESGGRPIAADIVDFKTDELKAGDKKAIRKKVEFYQPQMDAYRAAVSRLTGLEPECIAARLVFLGAGEVCSL